MIAKAIPMRVPQKSHFGQLANYLTSSQDTPFRLGQVAVTNCYQDELNDVILEVLNTQAQNIRASSDKTYHLLVSFRAGEEPSHETLQAIESALCTALGFSEHQRISAVHHDTDNLHVHIAINKVHPVKHTIHNPYQDYKILAECCQKLERDYGLEIDNHTPQRTSSAGRARDMERHAGVESLISWIQQNVFPTLQQAHSWSEFHTMLHEHGLRIKARGNGLTISLADDSLNVKASSVARELSKARMEQRFGCFEPADDNLLANHPIKQRYLKQLVSGTMDSTSLYSAYQTAQLEHTLMRNETLTKTRHRHQAHIQQVKSKAAQQRRWIKALIKPGINKKLLLGISGKALKNDIQRLNADFKQQRQQIFAQHRRKTWLDWLQQQAEQGNQQALQYLRNRQVKTGLKGSCLSGQPSATAKNEPALVKAKITKKGTVFYCHGQAVIKDDGNSFSVSAHAGQNLLLTALLFAKDRYGSTLSLQGDERFKENVVRASVKANLAIRFDQAEWEQRRVTLCAERQWFGDGAVKNLSSQAPIGRSR